MTDRKLSVDQAIGMSFIRKFICESMHLRFVSPLQFVCCTRWNWKNVEDTDSIRVCLEMADEEMIRSSRKTRSVCSMTITYIPTNRTDELTTLTVPNPNIFYWFIDVLCFYFFIGKSNGTYSKSIRRRWKMMVNDIREVKTTTKKQHPNSSTSILTHHFGVRSRYVIQSLSYAGPESKRNHSETRAIIQSFFPVHAFLPYDHFHSKHIVDSLKKKKHFTRP